jgi:hypothetical protein
MFPLLSQSLSANARVDGGARMQGGNCPDHGVESTKYVVVAQGQQGEFVPPVVLAQ